MMKSLAVAAFATLVLAMLAPRASAAPIPLTLINGWTNAPFSTSIAAYENIGGIVHFKGAIATAGTKPSLIFPSMSMPLWRLNEWMGHANGSCTRADSPCLEEAMGEKAIGERISIPDFFCAI